MNRIVITRGFTLVEILVVIAILGVLSAIAIIGYRHYIDRARATEIVEKFDTVRTRMGVTLAQGAIPCADIGRPFDGKSLEDPYARLSINVVAAQGGAGWRPVMVVCARADRHGSQGVGAAREAHNIFTKNHQIESGAVLTGSVVTFAVPLSQGTGSQCTGPFSTVADACGDPLAGQAPAQVSQNTPVVGPQVPPPVTQGPGQNSPQNPAISVQPPLPQTQNPAKPPIQAPPSTQNPGSSANSGTGQGTSTQTQGSGINPGTGLATSNPQRPGVPVLDGPQLMADLLKHPAMASLGQREKNMVAGVATDMALDPVSYGSVVRRVLNGTPYRQPVDLPSAQTMNTIRFSPEMRAALDAVFPEALRRMCVAKNGPNAQCG